MPKELIAISPQTPVFRKYQEPQLKSNEVRIRSIFSSPKHGTGLRSYRADSADYTSSFDLERGIHIKGKLHKQNFPISLGNMTIGVVIKIGKRVRRFRKGDRVFGYFPIRETHTISENRVYLVPKGMSAEAIVYSDPANVALYAVRDAKICLGDRVAVFGLGAIGQMALQIARLQGARWIAATDPIILRREAAARYDVDLVLNPLEKDVGLAIKDRTDKKGVDVSLETSGAYSALNDALRVTGYGGIIVSLAYYTGNVQDLKLEGEWHRNRLTLISSRVVSPRSCASEPLRDHPRWNAHRIHAEAFKLLKEGRLSVEGLIAPVVPFNKAVEAYQEIDEAPEKSIKLGIVYPS